MAPCQTNDTPLWHSHSRHKTVLKVMPHMSFRITPKGKRKSERRKMARRGLWRKMSAIFPWNNGEEGGEKVSEKRRSVLSASDGSRSRGDHPV